MPHVRQTLYTRVIAITEDYLGPAAPRFVNRITTNHLDKPATQLSHDDLPELITWVQLAANVMTDNTTAIEQYVGRLQALRKTASLRTDGSTTAHLSEAAY